MGEIELKAKVIAILARHTRGMQGYLYFSSNPGIPEGEYEEIADEVIAALATKWQSIDSAPRNGTRILIAMDGVDRAVLSYWDGSGFATIDGNDWTGRNITAWQPLPAPPEVD